MSDTEQHASVRKLLRTFGMGAQQALEDAIRQAVAAGTLAPGQIVTARATLTIDGVDTTFTVDEAITVAEQRKPDL